MKGKFLKLMENNGFIAFLFVIVCVLVGGTLYLSMGNLNRNYNKGNEEFMILDNSIEEQEHRKTEEVALHTSLDDLEEDKEKEEINLEEINLNKPNESDEPDELEFEDDIEELEEIKDVNLVMSSKNIIFPVEGPIITEYTSDTLVYSDTLEAWIGHGAIDIGAKEGTPVKAAMDGTIKQVYEDELWGIVILIDHGNEMETKYANLSTKEMVKEGIVVKQGDHISKIGKTAKIEMLMDDHLHFELIKNGKIVDPRSIIK